MRNEIAFLTLFCLATSVSAFSLTEFLTFIVLNSQFPIPCPCIDELTCIPALNISGLCVKVSEADTCDGLLFGFTECEICTSNGLTYCPGEIQTIGNATLPLDTAMCTNNPSVSCDFLPPEKHITCPKDCPAPLCGDDCPKKFAICHKPGTDAEKTLHVASAAIPGHLDHGDTIGPCDGGSDGQVHHNKYASVNRHRASASSSMSGRITVVSVLFLIICLVA